MKILQYKGIQNKRQKSLLQCMHFYKENNFSYSTSSGFKKMNSLCMHSNNNKLCFTVLKMYYYL